MRVHWLIVQAAFALSMQSTILGQASTDTTQAVLTFRGSGTASSVGPDGNLQTGYATVTIDSGSAPHATAVLSYTQNGIVVCEVGVSASPPTLSARLFVEFRTDVNSGSGTVSVNTGVAAVNMGTSAANINLLLRDLQGNTISAGSVQLAANSHLAKFIDQFAPAFVLPANFSSMTGFGSLEVTSDQPISILALRLTTNQRGESLLTSTPIADMSSALVTTSLNFPQIADGGGYQTALLLLNTSTAQESGTISFMDNNGSPLKVRMSGDAAAASQFSYQIPPNGALRLITGGKITITGGSVTSSGSGANGLFATGSGSSITMSNGTIKASGGNAHGVDVTYGGTITLTNVNVTTSGASSSALATDFGGGTVNVTGGTIIAASTSANSHSAAIYSTGNISVSGATAASRGDCGGVIDGANSISLTNTALTALIKGFKLWKTAPSSGTATVSITGGSVTVTAGDAFYITGETGNAATGSITVKGGATISASTGNVVNVVSSSTASFTADGEALAGNLIADSTSTIAATLQNQTTLTGIVQRAAMTIDSTSVWNVTGNSILTSLTDTSGISGLSVTNIIGNGYDVSYDASLAANKYLAGQTYSLVNGGRLMPK